MSFTIFPIPTVPLSSLSAESLSNGVTGTGAIVLQNSPTITGITYLGVVNSSSFPITGIGTALSWNFSGGNGEVDIWNVFPRDGTSNDAPAFIFKQLSGPGTANTLATLYQGGRLSATMFTAGGLTGQANQLELIETGLAAATGHAQARFARTEANTADEAQIIITHHKTGGTGNVSAIDLTIDTTAGSDNFFIGMNALCWGKNTGAAYHADFFGSIFTAKVDAGLPLCTATGIEVDLDIRGNITNKIGISVVDEATSVGGGTGYDVGIIIGRQAGARGFDYGLLFGFNPANAAAEINKAFLYCPAGTIPYAVDFSGVTFSTAAWKGNFTATGIVKGLVTVVSLLPSATASGAGARAFVTDANATTFASIVAAGGANGVPVYSDGTNWRIG